MWTRAHPCRRVRRTSDVGNAVLDDVDVGGAVVEIVQAFAGDFGRCGRC